MPTHVHNVLISLKVLFFSVFTFQTGLLQFLLPTFYNKAEKLK